MSKLITADVRDRQAWVATAAQKHLRALGVLAPTIFVLALLSFVFDASSTASKTAAALQELWFAATSAWANKNWPQLAIAPAYLVGLTIAVVGLAAVHQVRSVFRNVDRSLEQSAVALMAGTALLLPVGYEALRLASLESVLMGGALFAWSALLIGKAVQTVKVGRPRLQGLCLAVLSFAFIMAVGARDSAEGISEMVLLAMLLVGCILIVGLRVDIARQRKEDELRYWLSIGGDYLGKPVRISEWLDADALRISIAPDLLEPLIPYSGKVGRVLALEPHDIRPALHIEFKDGAEARVVVTGLFNRTWIQICEE